MMAIRLPIVFLSLLFFASSVFSQQSEEILVRDIQVVNLGSGKLDANFVNAHTATKLDSSIDRNEISRDVNKLLGTGRFSDVRVEMEPVEDGVRLVYSFLNKYRLSEPVEVRGSKRLNAQRTRDVLGVYPGDLIDMQVLEFNGLKIIDEYKEDYFPFTQLRWEIIETDKSEGLARVVLTVDEGNKAKVRRIIVDGNSQVETEDLLKAMKRRAPWDPRWIFRKKRYSTDELEMLKLTVRELYLNRGFLGVVVDSPVVEKDEEDGLQVRVTVHEGTQYAFGDVSVSGVTLFPQEQLDRLVTMREGRDASTSDIERVRMQLRDYYGGRGYLNTVVDPVIETDETTGVANIKYSISEGELTKIRNIIIRGNTRTRDKVIRRELRVYPGDIYNEVNVRRSKLIISNLGYFSSVRMRPQDTTLPDLKDIIMDVEEKPTGNLMMGAGFSSIDKVMGFIELSQGNFDISNWRHPTGGGQKLKLRAQFGSTRELYELSFVEPWFLDRKLSLGVDLYSTEISSSDYDVSRTGGAISLTKKLPGPNRLRLRYELEKVSSITDTNQYYFIESDEQTDFIEDDRVQSTFNVSVIHNTCDSPFSPTRGLKASLYGSVSGGPFGFDTDIYTLGVNASQFFPLWYGHVLSFRGRCEVVDTFNDTEEVPYSERLFLGGGRTIRGFDYRDVGPKVLTEPNVSEGSYRAYGGRSLLFGSAGYTIPIVQGVRLAFFYDIGNVWRDEYEFSGHNLASSAGSGLRLDVPGFPIRLDRAWTLKKDHEITNEDDWAIWIGHDF